MKYFRQWVMLAFMGIYGIPQAQEVKKTMTFDDMVSWERITEQRISNDGKWVACKMEPWRGDATVFLYNEQGKEISTFRPAGKAEFSYSSAYLLVTMTPGLEQTESLQLKKTKSENMPPNSLVIRRLEGGEELIDSLKSYKLSESADWIAYQRGSKVDSMLHVRSLDGKKQVSIPAVTDFRFAEKNNVLFYVSDSLLYTYNPQKGSQLISEKKGVFKKITFNKNGDKLAFLYCSDGDSTATCSTLFLSVNNQIARSVAQSGDEAFPVGWIISENENLRFSENSERLFFGTAPAPRQKDTTVLAANFPKVQIWKWDEGVQYTEQTYNKERDLKKAYTALYTIDSNKLIQLATPAIPELQTADEGNASIALLTSSLPYETAKMWEGRTQVDIYTVNLQTGVRQQMKKEASMRMTLSPKGNYAYWYSQQDSSWYTYSLVERKEYRLSAPSAFQAWDEENDVPDYPDAYGLAGWTTDDRDLLIYDRYDIWKFDPTGKSDPVNLTVNGRKENISYRLVQLDKEKKSYNLGDFQFLTGFNHLTKGTGYYKARFRTPVIPEVLLAGNFLLNTPLKAKKADALLYTAETFEKYPDVHLTNMTIQNPIQLTHGGRQQDGLNWGTAELTSWISLDGVPLEGVIYKPENFDPDKKYPVIVNFYERNASTLYSYHMPEAHRSTIDYHFYTSNGYIVFNPDVRYTGGYPGESCFNCVMPGITALIAKGYINEKAIGAQGHSWGGYQVAYLATRTNLFAAIESGAPVVNMFSAYGGIRWGSGLNRSFQYEHGQSRIGATLWEKPLQYIENSPLFTMDKVETPILIMHNDNDGHVPWYQGIEYFIALKRLQKPVWLLNYTGEIHWPMRLANRIDFQKRMFQFFDHYLKGTPQPVWMSEGIPAVNHDFDLGY